RSTCKIACVKSSSKTAYYTDVADASHFDVSADHHQINSAFHRLPEAQNDVGRMLQIGVDQRQHLTAGDLPTVARLVRLKAAPIRMTAVDRPRSPPSGTRPSLQRLGHHHAEAGFVEFDRTAGSGEVKHGAQGKWQPGVKAESSGRRGHQRAKHP